MTTTDSQTLRLRGPADLVAVVPYLLGFQPHESLVLVGLAGTRVAVTARMDLTDATLEVVSGACGTLRRNGATAVAGIIVTDHPDLASDVQRHLTNAAERCSARRARRAAGDRRPVALAARHRPGMPGAARQPAADRADGGGRGRGVRRADRAAQPGRARRHVRPGPGRPNLGAELRRHWGLRDAAGEDGELAGWERSAVRALFAAQRAAQGAGCPPTTRRPGSASRSAPTRCATRSGWPIDDGRLEGIELWVDLARRLPHPYDAAPLFLAGWHAYRQGNGALAGIAADLATDRRPRTTGPPRCCARPWPPGSTRGSCRSCVTFRPAASDPTDRRRAIP